MSWLLFLDESGHDHKQMPYEVRGGIALRDAQLWPFVQSMQRLELDSFGGYLHQYRAEIKGCTLLDRKRFRFALQEPPLEPEARRKHCRGFVSSNMTAAVQAADLCIYCINWGFRLPQQGMDAPVRNEITEEFSPWLNQLQYHGDGYKDGQVFKSWGITYVPNPYAPGRAQKKEVMPLEPPESNPAAEPPDTLSA